MANKKLNNIFDIKNITSVQPEIFENIIEKNDFKLDRIITQKPYDRPGKWYDQDKDEWVLLLQGEATIEFQNKEIIQLISGDYIFIPSHKRHRIKESSQEQKCIWLAIHGNLK